MAERTIPDVRVDNFTDWSFLKVDGQRVIEELGSERTVYDTVARDFIQGIELTRQYQRLAPDIAQMCIVQVHEKYARPNPAVITGFLGETGYDMNALKQLMDDAYTVRNFGSPSAFWEQMILGDFDYGPSAGQSWHPDDVLTCSIWFAKPPSQKKSNPDMIFMPR